MAVASRGRRSTVRPASIDEVSKTVAQAHEKGQQVCVRSSFQEPPEEADVIMDLSRLDDVEHQPEDMVASVGCGARFREFQAGLAGKGQRLPLDPPTENDTTVGDAIAFNAYGPLRLRFGTLRDWMIGSTLVRFDGKVVRAGGMVVKNVSGYDLTKLYIGSRHALGIVVRANFKLSPLPRAHADVLVDSVDPAKGAAIVEELRSGLHPLVSAVLIGRRLLLGYEGVKKLLDRQVTDSLKVSGGRRVADRDAKPVHAETVRLQSKPALTLHYPPSACGGILSDLGPPPDHVTFPGCGVTFLADSGFARKAEAACAARGGWMSPGPIPPDTLSVMNRIKKALDPDETFGPVGERS